MAIRRTKRIVGRAAYTICGAIVVLTPFHCGDRRAIKLRHRIRTQARGVSRAGGGVRTRRRCSHSEDEEGAIQHRMEHAQLVRPSLQPRSQREREARTEVTKEVKSEGEGEIEATRQRENQ